MPKLDKKTAQKVNAQESGNFDPVPPGRYPVVLHEVTVEQGPKGPYWKWTFKIPADAAEFSGRRFWLNTSLAENALWKMKEVFDAFGYTTDTSTDELLGEMVIAQIGTRTIQAGSRKGEEGNEIVRLIAYEDDEETEEDDDDEDEDDEEEAPPPPARKKSARKVEPEPEEEDEEDEDEEEEDVAPAPVKRKTTRK